MKERDVQAKIRRDLKKRGYLTLKLEPADKVGIPDLLLLGEGEVAFVEVKTTTGKLSAKQTTMHNIIRRYGGDVLTIYGYDQYAELRDKHFPRRTIAPEA